MQNNAGHAAPSPKPLGCAGWEWDPGNQHAGLVFSPIHVKRDLGLASFFNWLPVRLDHKLTLCRFAQTHWPLWTPLVSGFVLQDSKLQLLSQSRSAYCEGRDSPLLPASKIPSAKAPCSSSPRAMRNAHRKYWDYCLWLLARHQYYKLYVYSL